MLDLARPRGPRPDGAAGKKKTGIAGHDQEQDRRRVAATCRTTGPSSRRRAPRAKKIAKASLDALKAAGVPAYKVVVKNLGGDHRLVRLLDVVDGAGLVGRSRRRSPTKRPSPRPRTRSPTSRAHCEQWFRMARLRAGAEEVRAGDRRPSSGSRSGSPTAAKKKPLKGTSPRPTRPRPGTRASYGKKTEPPRQGAHRPRRPLHGLASRRSKALRQRSAATQAPTRIRSTAPGPGCAMRRRPTTRSTSSTAGCRRRRTHGASAVTSGARVRKHALSALTDAIGERLPPRLRRPEPPPPWCARSARWSRSRRTARAGAPV